MSYKCIATTVLESCYSRLEDDKIRESLSEILARRKKEKEIKIDLAKKQFCEFMTDRLNEYLESDTKSCGVIRHPAITVPDVEKCMDEFIAKFGKTFI